MSQIFKDCVGPNCNWIIFRKSEGKVMDITIMNMFEYNAISPEEMTSGMKSKLREYTCVSRFTAPTICTTKVF
jgi:hypothetical protein